MFWQLTVDCADAERMVAFWREALGYEIEPPLGSQTWWRHYADRLAADPLHPEHPDRLFPPDGAGPALWFQEVPEAKAVKNRLHLDLYPTGRDDSLDRAERIRLVEEKVAALIAIGATLRERVDEPGGGYFVGLRDPEGNEFCVN